MHNSSTKKKVVLYYPQNANISKGRVPGKEFMPLSCLTIAAYPLKDGYEVVVVDGNLYSQEEAHRRVVEACEGAIVYGTTGILGYQVADGFICTQRVKAKHPDLPAVIGGWFASVAPELQLETGLYDAVCLGQGEITFREMLQAYSNGTPLDDVAGLALWRDGQCVRTAHRTVVGWEQLLDVPWHLIDFDVYREQQIRDFDKGLSERLPRPPWIPHPKKFIGLTYYSSFGCPEPCTFCCSPEVTGLRWKAMPAQRMLDDLTQLQERWKFDVVGFFDANWGVAEKRVKEFADLKLKSNAKFGWYATMQIFSLLRYKPETIDALAEAGLYAANCGGETATEEMRVRIKKHLNQDDDMQVAGMLGERGITAWMSYIVGYPGESEQSMMATLEQARRIRSTYPTAHTQVWPFQPIPGTELYKEALEEGYLPPENLIEWGDFIDYNRSPKWKTRLPRKVLDQRRLFYHLVSLSEGIARGRIGWWERRAQKHLRESNFGVARIEAKAFDLYLRASRVLGGKRGINDGSDGTARYVADEQFKRVQRERRGVAHVSAS